jgi:hypothetical protein
MSDFNTSKIDGNTVGSGEWNQLSDVDNLVINSGQTPSTSNLDQLSIASARYSSGGQFFTDSGTANAYVLTPVSPFKSPVSSGVGEGYFNGMIIIFRAGNANSGASTVNVNGAGVKNLKKTDGTDVATGDILTTVDVVFRYNGTNFIKLEGVNPATKTNYGTSQIVNSPIVFGLNSTDPNNDIDFFVNSFYFDDGSGSATLTSNLTKRLDANWVAGNNQGGLDTGTKSVNTWYYGYAIYNPTTNVADIIFSASPTSPTLPSGFTKKRRIKGAFFLTNASANIRGFLYFADGGQYIWGSPITVHSSQNTSGSQTNDVSVPRIYGMVAYVQVQGLNDATNAFSFTTIGSGGMSINSGNTGSGDSINNGELPILNNTSSASIAWGGSLNRRNFIYTYGFIDTTNY